MTRNPTSPKRQRGENSGAFDVHPRWRFALVFGLCLAAAGCDYVPPGKPDPADRPRTPAQITNFEFLYKQNCSGCHGANGTLGPAPPLNDPIFLAIVPDEELVRVITDGRPGTPMPAFARQHQGRLTDRQIEIIALGLKQHWKSDKLPAATLPPYTVASKPAAEADAERGAKVFARACADCHGADGEGSGPEESPGRINNPALLTLVSDQALRRIVITGRHDLGMPNFADDVGRGDAFQPLSSGEIADLVALLSSWRKQELPGGIAGARPVNHAAN
ncbi:MAG: c-type cytochrome [Pirellulales bacterium]